MALNKRVWRILKENPLRYLGVIDPAEFADIGNGSRFYSVRFQDRTQSLNQQAVQFRERLHAEGVTESEWVDIMNNKRARMAWASITGLKTMSIPVPAAMFCCAAMAEKLGIKAGDRVSLISKQDGQPYVFSIDAVADSYAGQFIFMPVEALNRQLGLQRQQLYRALEH